MSKVRCKFQCHGVDHKYTGSPDNVFCEVKLSPVWTGENGENKSWSKATPQGQLTLGITNPDAIAEFELGGYYYLDISPAPAVKQ